MRRVNDVVSTLPKRLLILCVDRDNDLGERLGIPTPVVGRDNIIKVALQYILRYPDDSDANAMFGAVQLYDSLASTMGRENVEVAVVAGASGDDVMSDMKLMSEVDKLLEGFDADGIIVVSDGPSDEVVIPMLQSRRPVISVKRIVVKQTRGVEEFAVLTRYYVGKLVSEPRYRRYVMGIPGLLLLLYGVFSNVPSYIQVLFSTSISIILGLLLLIYGFNIHRDLLRIMRRYEITFFVGALSVFLAIIYTITTTYVLHSPLYLTGVMGIFNFMGIIVASILIVNSLEIYLKLKARPYGRLAAAILVSSFLFIVAGDLYTYLYLGLNIFKLIMDLVIYTSIGVVSLIAIGIVRRRGKSPH